MRQYIDLIETRLQELKTFRSDNEDFKAFRDGPGQVSEVRPKNDLLNGFLDHLKDKGYTPISSGGFGAVFTHPSLDYVIKVFHTDPAYMKFLHYALANQVNPHLPRFRGRFMQIDQKYFAVRMERLEKVTESDALCAIDALEDYSSTKQGPRYMLMALRKAVGQRQSAAKALRVLEAQPTVIDTVTALRGAAKGFAMDITDKNVMQRADQTLVIVDPYWGAGR